MMEIKGRFKGRVALITGGGSGIGRGVALRLGIEGAKVALLDLNETALKEVKRELSPKGIEVRTYTVDVSNEAQVEGAIGQIEDDFGKVDVMVNAAGIVGPTGTNITDYPTEAFDKIYNVNMRGSFLMTKYTVRVMEKNGYGRILLIASIGGKEGNPGMVGYATTKSGVIGMVKAVGKEYATKNITVNGLAPAVIKTAMNAYTSQKQLDYMAAKIPVGRLGTVEEVAAMVSFIVSEENSFSTGFVYDISGGRATY